MKRKYLIQMRFAADHSDKARVVETVPQIKRIVEKISDSDCVLVWTATDGASFAYFANCERDSRWIVNELMSPGQHGNQFSMNRTDSPARKAEPSPMRTGDDLLVLEIGEDFTANGYSKGGTWLQRR